MYHEFEYVALFIFIVLVAKGFSKNWAIVFMVGLGLSQLFNLGVNTYEGFTSTSRDPRVDKINYLKQRIKNNIKKRDSHNQRIATRDAKIQQNKASIDKYRTERDNLEKSVMNIQDPVAKATALKSSDNEIKKRNLELKIKGLKEENEKLRTEIEQIKGNKRDTKTEIDKLEKDLKYAETDLAAHNARKKAAAKAKKDKADNARAEKARADKARADKLNAEKARADKANADKAKAEADAKAKAQQQAELNKLLGKKANSPPGPGPAKATAKFSLMQEDDSDQSDDEEMEPKLQSKRPDGFDYLDPSKISGLTQGATKLMSSQKDLFTFMNSITPFIENAKKMLQDVDVNQLTAGSK